MTKENKALLLKDLCARLPYGIKIFHNLGEKPITFNSGHLDQIGAYIIKPYLRPLSSMTEEEKGDYLNLEPFTNGWFVVADWLNSHHFDYRGLIEKGLALEAPKDMYKTK